jgi:hypothetical protein
MGLVCFGVSIVVFLVGIKNLSIQKDKDYMKLED